MGFIQVPSKPCLMARKFLLPGSRRAGAQAVPVNEMCGLTGPPGRVGTCPARYRHHAPCSAHARERCRWRAAGPRWVPGRTCAPETGHEVEDHEGGVGDVEGVGQAGADAQAGDEGGGAGADGQDAQLAQHGAEADHADDAHHLHAGQGRVLPAVGDRPQSGDRDRRWHGGGKGTAVHRRCTGARGGGHVRPQCCGAAQGHQAQGAQRLAPGRRCCSPPSPRRPPGAQPAARSARGRGQGRSRGLGQAAEHSWMRRLAAGPLGLPASKQHRRTGRPAQPSPAQHRRTCVTQMAVLSASCQKEPWRT